MIARIADLMQHETAGDPISGLKWTRKTREKVCSELRQLGILVSPNTVGRLLRRMGYSLRVNHKQLSRVCKGRGKNKSRQAIVSLPLGS